jgi:hypothetical protein
MNITVNTDAALEDAKDIDTIVQSIETNLEKLDKTIDTLIPERLETTWSNRLKEEWTAYYKDSIANGMEEMKVSATNLRIAVNEALEYDSGN